MNPMEQPYPDDSPVDVVNITARRTDKGAWVIYCPEWECEFVARTLADGLRDLARDITKHNAECRSIEHKPARWAFEPMPDDGTRTPVYAMWQR